MKPNSVSNTSVDVCWCGEKYFVASPHADYRVCRACGTAKLRVGLATGQDPVTEEQSHLYGEHYWNEHMRQFGYPTLSERVRGDLSERAQYWLAHLLKYRLPPGRTLEIGSAHGGFVKLLSVAGFNALGMEMSPGIIEKSKQWFKVDISRGPIEHSERELGMFDVILLFDVLEHFADPASTMRVVLSHVAPDGVVVLQTPNYDDVGSDRWHQFKPPEHTYLFSSASIHEFLCRLGFEHLAYEQPIFGGDMFVFASRLPLMVYSPERIADRLATTPDGRLALAMQDLYAQVAL